MNTSAVIRAVGFVLLTALACGLAWQTRVAGGPPVWVASSERWSSVPPGQRLSYGYLAVPQLDYDPIVGSRTSQLIPTYWETNTQLIPTEIEAQTFTIQQTAISPNLSGSSNDPSNYLNRQLQILTRPTSATPPRNSGYSPIQMTLTPPTTAPRVTSRSRVATVPASPGRRRHEANPAPKEAIPQQK